MITVAHSFDTDWGKCRRQIDAGSPATNIHTKIITSLPNVFVMERSNLYVRFMFRSIQMVFFDLVLIRFR